MGTFFHGGVTFSRGIPCQCVCRTPVLGGLSQTSLPDFRQAAKNGSNFHDLGIARLPACLHFCHRKLTANLGTSVIATSAMEVMRSGEARARYNKSSYLIFSYHETSEIVAHVGIIGHDRILVSMSDKHYTNLGIIESKKLSVNLVDKEMLNPANRIHNLIQ